MTDSHTDHPDTQAAGPAGPAGSAGPVWVSHPFRQSARRATIASLTVLGSGVVTYLIMSSPGFGLLATIVMFFSLSKFFFPARYSLDDSGVTVKTTTQTFTRPWNQFRSYYVDANGILLSPFAVPSRLENFRGLYITFSGNKDEVVEFVKARVKAPSSPLAPDVSDRK